MSRVDPLSHRPKGTLGGLATRVVPRVVVPLVVVALLGTSIAMSRAEGTTIAYPPPSEETQSGLFIVRCPLSHRAQVDPIVNPGPSTPSAHVHDFFGNRSTTSNSTYGSMTAAGTTCGLSRDTAAYWQPTLRRADGTNVNPVAASAYYRNRPVGYGKTVPFPPDFRMIAGGVGSSEVFWNCFRDDSETVKYSSPPFCRDDYLRSHIFFPSCWDGVNRDSPNHRSHVVYPTGTGRTACPSSHPVKLPAVRFFVRYPKNSGGPGWKLSDGTTLPHADFWNTWQQPALEDLVRRCLNPGVNCGKQVG